MLKGTCRIVKQEVNVGPRAVDAYVKAKGNTCPLPKCGGAVEGTGAQEWLDGDEIAVGRECQKCGATWDDFYALADMSLVDVSQRR